MCKYELLRQSFRKLSSDVRTCRYRQTDRYDQNHIHAASRVVKNCAYRIHVIKVCCYRLNNSHNHHRRHNDLVSVVDFAVQFVDEHNPQVAVRLDERVVSHAQTERSVARRSQLVARDAVTTRVRVDGCRHDERTADLGRLRQLVHDAVLGEAWGIVVDVDYLHPHLLTAMPRRTLLTLYRSSTSAETTSTLSSV